MKYAIEVNNLKISDLNNRDLIKSISFNIPKSASVGIVGESGSGKSLTMKFVLGLLPDGLNASAEHLQVLGKNPYNMSNKQLGNFLGQQIGYIPQNTVEYLHPLIKIKDQIVDGYMKHNNTTKKTAHIRALELLKLVEIISPEQVMESLPSELSGGMRQRVNIAMAMMNEPQLMIADEPTTALDAEVQFQVMELLKKIHENTRNTMIIVSHNLGIIHNYCDYVIVLYNGVIQEVGTIDEIFNAPQAPYTKALLAVRLTLNQDKSIPLKDISYFLGEEVVL